MPVISENWKLRRRHNWYSKIMRKYQKLRTKGLLLRNPIRDSEIVQKAEREKQLIIQVRYGGLGDHLVYSSLPELLWEQKGIKTFISTKSVFRNSEVFDFVWKLNTFVEFTDKQGWYSYKPLKHDLPTLDGYFQYLFNLQADGCPKIYYKPKLIEQLKGKTIVDPSCGPSGKANGYFEPDFYNMFIRYLKNNVGEFVLITHQHSGTKSDLQRLIQKEFNPKSYTVCNIEQLSDAMYSADKRYLLHSGTASLAAALRVESNVINYIKPSTYDSFKYRTNTHVHLL